MTRWCTCCLVVDTSIGARRTACRLVYHSSRGRCRMRRSRSPVSPYSGCVVSACCAGAPVAREQRNGAQSHALQTKGGCLTLRARRHRVFAAPSLASCKNRRHSHSVSWYLPSLVLAELATGSALDTEARMLVLVAVATADRAMLMPELTTSLTPGATSHAR